MSLTLLALSQAALAQSTGRRAADARAPAEIVAAAPAAEWRAIPASDLMVMELAPDAAGRPRRVVIQLMPAPFGQGWVDNIRALARAHWWDGLSVNRVQDNYVAQWGDASEQKPLPAGLRKPTEAAYTIAWQGDLSAGQRKSFNAAKYTFWRWHTPDPLRDAYSNSTGFIAGWPLAFANQRVWPVHCYGTVGVGRNLSPDTGTGAELYAVIGHAPRHLDRNIAVVGRVAEGIEHLSSLPRGSEALGFYKTAAERVPIRSIRLASELPAAEQPRFEYLATDGAVFGAYMEARANRQDAFFIQPAGGADICNVPVPVRRAK